MPTISPVTLRDLVQQILEAVGTSPTTATFMAESLVDSNLAGHDSHGVMRLLLYAETARAGHVDAAVEPTLVSRTGATAIVDAHYGWGQPAMWLATGEAIDLARQFGIGAAAVQNCYHIGRVAPYVERIAAARCIGIAMANAGPAVAPYGSRKRILGTNPIAWAAPRAGDQPSLSFDIATAMIAEGKVRVAKAKGELVPPGVIVTTDGVPSQIPDDFYDGGALLPFGGHKGSGLSLLAQVIGRGLAGLTPQSSKVQRGVNGPFVIAINPDVFTPFRLFLDEIESQCDEISASEPMEGFDRVRLPGEPETESRERRADGIPVPERTWQDLCALAAELGVLDDRWSA
jgi:LDH2 family malate/lactate/ureidoglycolate dehydrogenase